MQMGSAVAYDGFNCRHYQYLCDDALDALAMLFEVMEAFGELPGQISAVLLALLSKPTGGCRPIGLFCS
eukprot:6571140-Pyramimonas_sp.AAC.1